MFSTVKLRTAILYIANQLRRLKTKEHSFSKHPRYTVSTAWMAHVLVIEITFIHNTYQINGVEEEEKSFCATHGVDLPAQVFKQIHCRLLNFPKIEMLTDHGIDRLGDWERLTKHWGRGARGGRKCKQQHGMHYFKYLFFALKWKYPQIKLYLQAFFLSTYIMFLLKPERSFVQAILPWNWKMENHKYTD